MSISSFPISDSALSAGEDASSQPGLQDLLDSGDFVICAEQRFSTIGTSLDHILIFSTEGFTTLSTDTPASYEVAPQLDGDIQTAFKMAITESGIGSGQAIEIRILIPDAPVYLHTVGQGNSLEALSMLQTQRQCGGRPFKLKIGQPQYGYDSFHTVFETYADGLTPDGRDYLVLELRDYGRNLNVGILSTFAGTGGEEGTADLAGQVREKHFGAATNVQGRLALPATNTYHVTARTPTSPMPTARDGGVVLTEDISGYPFADFDAFQAHTIAAGGWVQWRGWARTNAEPESILTFDLADAETVPSIMRKALEEAGVASTGIWIETEDYDYGADNGRSEAWQAFAATMNAAPAQAYISSQENVIDFVDRMAKTHGFSRYQDRDGRMCFAILDYRLHSGAVSGTDYVVIDNGDNIDLEPLALPETVWPPRFREYVGYNQNHTVLTSDQVLAGASAAFRQFAVVDGRTLYYPDVTPEISSILAALPNAVDPERNMTALINQADAEALATWFHTRSALTRGTGATFLSQRRMFRFTMPLSTGYGINFMKPVKITIDPYWPDAPLTAIGQMLPPAEDWSNVMMAFDFYPYGLAFVSVLLSSLESPSPPGGGIAIGGGNVLATLSSSNNVFQLYDVTDRSAVNLGEEVALDDSPEAGEMIGTTLFAAVPGTASIPIYNVADYESAALLTNYEGPSPGTTFAGVRRLIRHPSDSTILFAVTSTHLIAINVATPSSPAILGSYTDAGTSLAYTTAIDISDDGDTLYLADPTGMLTIYNVSAPASITRHSKTTGLAFGGSGLGTGAGAFDMANAQGVLFVSACTGVAIVDATDPAAPSYSSTFAIENAETTGGVIRGGGYLYVATQRTDGVGEVDVLSIDDLSNPTRATVISAPVDTWINGIMALCRDENDYIYASTDTGMLLRHGILVFG